MDFFKKYWVEIVAFVMFVVSIVILAISGFTSKEISPLVDSVFAILDLVSLLILAIKKLIQKKDTAMK